MTRNLKPILDKLKLHPVLIDVGASGEAFPIWEPIRANSTYIGFDADDRDLQDTSTHGYRKYHIVNKAVTAQQDQNKVKFYLTKSPACSSILPPDLDSLRNFHYTHLFEVVGEVEAPAVTLDDALSDLGMKSPHWLKLDSQGTDLRLLKSIDSATFGALLAIDVEPGLMDAYQGEDLFTDVQAFLSRAGFWLSRSNVLGAVRISEHTRKKYPAIADLIPKQRTTPGWVEARYLRTIESLNAGNYMLQDYLMLWTFAIVDDQPGFALDVLNEAHIRFPSFGDFQLLEDFTLESIKGESSERVVRGIKRFIPNRVKHSVKQVLKKLIQ